MNEFNWKQYSIPIKFCNDEKNMKIIEGLVNEKKRFMKDQVKILEQSIYGQDSKTEEEKLTIGQKIRKKIYNLIRGWEFDDSW